MQNEAIIIGGISKMLVNKIESMINDKSIKDLKFLGKGAFGRVFALGNLAIKVFDDAGDDNGDALKLKKLQGENSPFPKLYAYKEGSFMISERIMSKTLWGYHGQTMELKEYFAEHMKTIIKYAFDRGLVVSDIKQDNLMIKNGLPIVVDVGNFLERGDRDYDDILNIYRNYIDCTLDEFYKKHRVKEKEDEYEITILTDTIYKYRYIC